MERPLRRPPVPVPRLLVSSSDTRVTQTGELPLPSVPLSVCLSRACLSPSLRRAPGLSCVCATDRQRQGKGEDGVSRLGFAPLITPGRADGWDTRARPEFAMQIHEESISSMLVFHGMSYTMYWSLEGFFP